MNITAHHAHVMPATVREDATLDALLRYMDACGISQCVAFAPFSYQFAQADFSPNRWLHDTLAGTDRVFGFGTIVFERGNLCDQVTEIADLGFRGIKLHPAAQHFHVMGEQAQEVYARAEELGLFLSFHTGVHWDRIANYHVLLFDEIAYHYRKLRFSMEHIGGYSFIREGLAVLENNNRRKETPQVFGGFTSIFSQKKTGAWYLTPEERMLAVEMGGENAILFGLDFPYNSVEYIRDGIRQIMEMPCDEAVKTKILGGNLRRIIGVGE